MSEIEKNKTTKSIGTTTFVPTNSEEKNPRRWLALAVCLSATVLTMLDVSIINVALPTIELKLSAGSTDLQIIVAGYTLAFGLALIPAGRLGDIHGRSKMFVVGIVLFGLTSLVAGLSTTSTALAICRVIQGASAGIINPQVTGIIQQLFDQKERAKAFSMIGMTVGVSTAIGPLLGGSILQFASPDMGWRIVFWVNVPIAILATIFAFKVFPFSKNPHHKVRFDLRGTLLIAFIAICIMIPFLGEGQGSIFTICNGELLLVAIVALVGLYFWERYYWRKHQSAVLDPRLLRNPSFRYGALLGCSYFSGFSATLLLITILLQNGLGCSPLQAGLVATPFAIASGLGARSSGKLVLKFGRKVVVGGVALCLLGTVLSAVVIHFVPVDILPIVLSITLFITGLGSGHVIAPNNTLTLAAVPVEIGSTAGGVMQLGQRVGQSIGMSITLSVFYGLLASGLSIEYSTSFAFAWTLLSLVATLVVSILDNRRRSKF
jgi:EmrB/QacA subfamily drug resistance transporter